MVMIYITSTVNDMELEIKILNDLRSILPATLPACLPTYFFTVYHDWYYNPTSFLFNHLKQIIFIKYGCLFNGFYRYFKFIQYQGLPGKFQYY